MSARNTILFWATVIGAGATTLTVPEVRCGVGLDTPETDRRCAERAEPTPPLSTRQPWPEPRAAPAPSPRDGAPPSEPAARDDSVRAVLEFHETPGVPRPPEMPGPEEERLRPRPVEAAAVHVPRSTGFRDTLRYPRSTEFRDTIRLHPGW